MTRAAAMLIALDRGRRDRRRYPLFALRRAPSILFVESFEAPGERGAVVPLARIGSHADFWRDVAPNIRWPVS